MAASVPVVAAASIDQRFAQLIQQFGLTKNSFAISLGKTASVVQHLIDGRNKPGFDLMCKVFEIYPNVSRDWLLLGRGPMLVGSNGLNGPSVAAAQPAAPEPDFEPIDLTDVAPRAARRPTVSRLHPEEIAATLALATAVVAGPPAVASSAVAGIPGADEPATRNPVLPLVSGSAPLAEAAAQEAPAAVAPASAQRPARPFRAGSISATRQPANTLAAAAPATAPLSVLEAEIPAPARPVADGTSMPVAPLVSPLLVPAPTSSLEAYVAAAIHAQHLQHQLALAELRNQHLLEQQQMLREMLAMARQSMV
ncbi:hypothetical protein [Hymenobacter sp. UYCo722]|uniref:hypothetical protein n=1 Tax=Hymenobacter sp. UYCo722 TaxID=3156335 RepID=UPI0033984AA5